MKVFITGSIKSLVGRHSEVHGLISTPTFISAVRHKVKFVLLYLINLTAQQSCNPKTVDDGIAGSECDPSVAVQVTQPCVRNVR